MVLQCSVWFVSDHLRLGKALSNFYVIRDLMAECAMPVREFVSLVGRWLGGLYATERILKLSG